MILRWLETLSHYEFDIEHRAGDKHGNADSLSRCTHAREPTAEEIAESEVEACNAMHISDPPATIYSRGGDSTISTRR